MRQDRIMNHQALKTEMQAVARGERPAAENAGQASFNSVEASTQVLKNRTDNLKLDRA